MAAVVLGLIFREEFARRLRHLSRIKTAGIEAEFREEIVQITRRADELPSPSSIAFDGSLAADVAVKAIDYPNMSVLSAWRVLEEQMRSVAASFGASEGAPVSVVTEVLRDRGTLSDADSALIRDMQRVRNAVAHDDSLIGPDSATAYVAAVQKLTGLLAGRTDRGGTDGVPEAV